MTSEQHRTTGQLQAALSNAIVRIKHDFYGKGPSRSRTYLFDEYVFAILEDVLTTAEQTLKAGGDGELVREVRLAFESMMTAAFVEQVEKLTGRTVVAYHSQILLERETAFEIFVLDPRQDGLRQPEDAIGEIQAADLEEPGGLGDADDLPSPGERPPPAPQRPADERVGLGPGPLRKALSNALVRVLHELYGKGASRARTYIADRYVICALEGVLTTVERTLVDGGEPHLVRRLRQRFHDLSSAAFAAEVRRLTGIEVVDCEVQVLFDPDTLFLVFVLQEPCEGS